MNTIDDILRHFAAETPGAPALTFNGATQSYASLDRRTNALADGLAKIGVGNGDRVAFVGRNRVEHFELIFAVAKVGGISLGLNWRLAARELEAQLRDCTPVLIFAAAENLPLVEAAIAPMEEPPAILSFEDAAGYPALVASGDPAPRAKVAAADDLCMICYTSGTTGEAKGVTFTHGSLWSIFPGAAAAWGFDRSSVSLVCMPTFHTAGACWGLLALSQGGHDVMVGDFDPDAIVALMAEARVTNSMFAPIMLEQVIAALEARPALSLPDLRKILYGAAPITEPVLARALATLSCGLVQGYGLTEINGTITILGTEDHVLAGSGRARLRSAGRAVPWGQVRVVDPATGGDLPSGVVGEVWGRSPGMMRGYWRRPAETAAAITPDGWLRTGDAGYLDEDGYLFLTDRIKDMIVTGGENVYPIEVEHVLAAHPSVDAVAVIGVPDAKWGETVKAVIQPHGEAPEPETLIQWAREHLARYKCPTSIDFIAEMPRNASGKILKRSLREPYWSGNARRIG
ncbi:long-chain-fatty-acid--CoA ligase [Sphingomonas colocasiae]|uniref:Long-chain-fatty-acid--CoA ligase n=1 Tax=Sphingomonas colocasiae TaxID=1848973 RepID=A0ABS7PK75_9SPHN|nr:long-chain-fatty-acid--CoA ligase [Sphingomonas colocasiae]MBY8821690.1 long-chain-fatty-acid--CoA ligase [Sphingomonas colocasiae]